MKEWFFKATLKGQLKVPIPKNIEKKGVGLVTPVPLVVLVFARMGWILNGVIVKKTVRWHATIHIAGCWHHSDIHRPWEVEVDTSVDAAIQH